MPDYTYLGTVYKPGVIDISLHFGDTFLGTWRIRGILSTLPSVVNDISSVTESNDQFDCRSQSEAMFMCIRTLVPVQVVKGSMTLVLIGRNYTMQAACHTRPSSRHRR